MRQCFITRDLHFSFTDSLVHVRIHFVESFLPLFEMFSISIHVVLIRQRRFFFILKSYVLKSGVIFHSAKSAWSVSLKSLWNHDFLVVFPWNYYFYYFMTDDSFLPPIIHIHDIAPTYKYVLHKEQRFLNESFHFVFIFSTVCKRYESQIFLTFESVSTKFVII